jgi:uncharacterized protein YjbI with pentapeptide repeats
VSELKRIDGLIITEFDASKESLKQLLTRLALAGVDLSWANLSGADLSGTNLSGANLSGAVLSQSNLSGVSLSEVNLEYANLSGANLIGANLSGANLSDANLNRANLGNNKYASCTFSNHGERGRMLTALKTCDGITFFCGCFKGSLNELVNYIEEGDRELKESRIFAMIFCIRALEL